MSSRIRSHRDLEAYRKAFEAAIQIFALSKGFPSEELYSLTDQIRRSSRSVCANLAEAWRKRRYEKAFVSKLSDAEGEAAETQVWIEFAVKFGYLSPEAARPLYQIYDEVLKLIVSMINRPELWLIGTKDSDRRLREEPGEYDMLSLTFLLVSQAPCLRV